MEKTHADTLREDYQTKTKEELINIVLQLKEEVWDLEIRLLDYEDE